MSFPSASDLSSTNQRGLAKAITLVERGGPPAEQLLEQLQSRIGRAHICGITGPPGAGKSALVERLAIAMRAKGQSVAIVAIDPSSPFSGGAVLGDRLRMAAALSDPGIYMRSLASRGHLGGLSASTADTICVLDAAGFDYIIVETVGAGQSEVDIMRLAHTTLVVTVPGLGDRIQADKAGILEIADIFVVNKSDLPGADKVQRELSGMLDFSHMGDPGLNHWPAPKPSQGSPATITPMAERYGSPCPGGMTWRPPVLSTSTISGSGIGKVLERIEQHSLFLEKTGRLEARLQRTINDALRRAVHAAVDRHCFQGEAATSNLHMIQKSISSGELSIKRAVEQLFQSITHH